MNKDVNVLYEDSDYIYISFDREPDCKYIIVGMNDIFNYENILVSDNNYVEFKKSDLDRYLNIRVDYVIRNNKVGKDVLIGHSNTLLISNHKLEQIDVRWIESYNGMTMSYGGDFVYDKYYIYEKNGSNYQLICDTEDFQVTLENFKKGNYYYVEGYKKDQTGYVLSAVSEKVRCECISISSVHKKLSIVVPIYNCEKFLCRCLDSILLSTFGNFELILVDDGSSDKSPDIVDWYHEKYGEIVKVVHKTNGGVSSARNEGIKLASCEYIAFLDNDDFVHPFMYEKLYSEAVRNNLDVVICPVIIRNGVDDYKICLNVKKDENFFIYDYEKMLSEKINNSFENIFFVAIWNKIMRTSLVKDHLFFSDSYYEDTAFTNTIYSYIDRFGFCKNVYYVWDKRLRDTVGTSTNSYGKKHNSLELNKKYCDALFYRVYYGNPLNINLLVYDSIRDAIMFTKDVDVFNKDNETFNIYKKKIIEISKQHDLKKNPYFQVDKKLYDDVVKILN